MPLRDYSGNSKATTLAGSISAAAISLTVADGTGYPTGTVGPFVVTIDAGLAGEEKVLCSARTGNTLTVATGGRGFDSTTAADHNNGAPVAHTYSATDAREANAHVNDTTTGDPHPQYLNAAEGSAAYVKQAGGDTITASGPTVRPLVVKGAASQSAALFEAQDSAGGARFRVANSGAVGIRAEAAQGLDPAANLHVNTGAAGDKGLVVRGTASQTANLQEWQNSAGTILANVFNEGTISTTGRIYASGAMHAGGIDAAFGTTVPLAAQATNAAQPVLVIRGLASQTGDLAQFQNSAGTVLLAALPNGALAMTSAGVYREILFGAADSAGAGRRSVTVLN